MLRLNDAIYSDGALRMFVDVSSLIHQYPGRRIIVRLNGRKIFGARSLALLIVSATRSPAFWFYTIYIVSRHRTIGQSQESRFRYKRFFHLFDRLQHRQTASSAELSATQSNARDPVCQFSHWTHSTNLRLPVSTIQLENSSQLLSEAIKSAKQRKIMEI